MKLLFEVVNALKLTNLFKSWDVNHVSVNSVGGESETWVVLFVYQIGWSIHELTTLSMGNSANAKGVQLILWKSLSSHSVEHLCQFISSIMAHMNLRISPKVSCSKMKRNELVHLLPPLTWKNRNKKLRLKCWRISQWKEALKISTALIN